MTGLRELNNNMSHLTNGMSASNTNRTNLPKELTKEFKEEFKKEVEETKKLIALLHNEFINMKTIIAGFIVSKIDELLNLLSFSLL